MKASTFYRKSSISQTISPLLELSIPSHFQFPSWNTSADDNRDGQEPWTLGLDLKIAGSRAKVQSYLPLE